MIRTTHAPPGARSRRSVLGGVAALLLAIGVGVAAPGGAAGLPAAVPPPVEREWSWPVHPFRLVRPYAAPAHEYGPGHRGIDLAPVGDGPVRAPADGVVAFAGDVAGRTVLTIDHGDGLVTTLEPVVTELSPGSAVARGDEVARVSSGGHTDDGAVHFGVRLHGEYINPMVLLGGVPRAVLLPCC